MSGYRLHERIDLIRNKKQLRLVTLLSVLLAAGCIAAGLLIQLPDFSSLSLVRFLAALAGIAVYIVGHEAVHGILIWCFSRRKPNFGFSLMYAYAGSDFFFAKTPYLLIAAAPLVFWTIVLSLLAALLPPEWFWAIWAIQITNVSGAAGDVYVFFHVLRKPQNVRIQDTGTAMSLCLPG